MSPHQLLALCSIFEESLNDPDLKAALDLPPAIHFHVTPLEGAAGSLPVKVTAVGTGFSAQASYAAEEILRQHLITQFPSLRTWPIADH